MRCWGISPWGGWERPMMSPGWLRFWRQMRRRMSLARPLWLMGALCGTTESNERRSMAAKIEDYALIGDCETAALVDKSGSIDFLCWPDFSSDACFASLLGDEENGYWKIGPAGEEWKVSRRYVDHTLILETT